MPGRQTRQTLSKFAKNKHVLQRSLSFQCAQPENVPCRVALGLQVATKQLVRVRVGEKTLILFLIRGSSSWCLPPHASPPPLRVPNASLPSAAFSRLPFCPLLAPLGAPLPLPSFSSLNLLLTLRAFSVFSSSCFILPSWLSSTPSSLSKTEKNG